MSRSLLLCLLLFCAGGADAFETIHSLEEVVSFVNNRTLVLLDIDDTLIRPASFPDHDDWSRDFLDRVRLAGVPSPPTADQMWFWCGISLAAEPDLMERCTATVVEVLQSRSLYVMGLTARVPESWWLTHHRLSKVGIDFSRLCPFKPLLGLLVQDTQIAYVEGILFTAFADKGESLRAFLDHIGFQPESIVFVDDNVVRIIEVERSAAHMGIPCRAYHYQPLSGDPNE